MKRFQSAGFNVWAMDAEWHELWPDELPEAHRHAQERFWRQVYEEARWRDWFRP